MLACLVLAHIDSQQEAYMSKACGFSGALSALKTSRFQAFKLAGGVIISASLYACAQVMP